MGSDFGVFLNCSVANAAREFHDSVMYFDANCAGYDILFTIKLGYDVFLNLHIVFHQAIPSQLIRVYGKFIQFRSAATLVAMLVAIMAFMP